MSLIVNWRLIPVDSPLEYLESLDSGENQWDNEKYCITMSDAIPSRHFCQIVNINIWQHHFIKPIFRLYTKDDTKPLS